ncbi:MAG TPA: TIGR03000 domain-containing protein [Gemmataceae bacterium]|nr:TIGR03000 domain-containing protein [Gemmataceae bacterium]
MYSMILMAALTAGSGTPDCHRCGCWGGCYGCYGGCYGCWGCYGGCYGCFGGCYGMGGYGGGMGGYGCWGGYSSWGGGYGYGGVGYPGAGYPGTIMPPGGAAPGAAAPGTPGQYEQLAPPPEDKDKDKSKKSKDKDKEGTMLNTTKAKLIVELPANAKLFIDDMPMKNASGVRSFNTPSLEPGQAYYYIVRVETVRNGKTVSESRRVIVRAGQVARADFKELETDAVRTAQAK